MNADQAHTAVALAAVWVALMFAYRKLSGETPTSAGARQLPQTAHFVIGFAFTFLVLSMLAEAAPPVGGMFAVLVATGDTLINGQALFGDVTGALKATSTATGGR